MAPAPSKIQTDIKPHVSDADAWKTFVRGFLKQVKHSSRRIIEGYVAEAEVFAMLEAISCDTIRIVRSGEAGSSDGAFVMNPEELEDIPPLGTPYLEMLAWAERSTSARFLTFDVKSVVFRPINNNKHQRAGTHEIAYKWSDTADNTEKADVIIMVMQGVENELAIVPYQVWKDARDWGYGIEPLMHKSPPWSQIFTVESAALKKAVGRLMRAAKTGATGAYQNPSTGVTLDGWKPKVFKGAAQLRCAETMRASYAAIQLLRRLIEGTKSGCKLFANMVQPLIGDCVLSIEGAGRPLFIEHKLRHLNLKADSPRFESGTESPFNTSRVWQFLVVQQPSANRRSQFLCIPRDAVRSHWHLLNNIPWEELSEFLCDGVEDLLDTIKSRMAGAIEAAAAAMKSIGDAGAEALVCTNSIERMKEHVANREDAYQRPDKGGSNSKGAEHFLRNLPWLSVDLNRLCAEYRYGLVFPLPIGHSICTHVFVDYAWQDGETLEGGLPLLISSSRLRNCKVLPLSFIDTKPHMSGVPDLGWPVHMSRNDWQRRSVQQDFLYVGSCMESAYMEADDTRKQYWLFSSEFTTQLTQKLKAPVPSAKKPGHFFNREGIEHDKLPVPKLHQKRKPTAIAQNTGFLAGDYEHVNPARYMLDGAEELYQHLCSILQGNGPIQIGCAQSMTPNDPVTAERHHATLLEILQATWDFGVARRPASFDDKVDAD